MAPTANGFCSSSYSNTFHHRYSYWLDSQKEEKNKTKKNQKVSGRNLVFFPKTKTLFSREQGFFITGGGGGTRTHGPFRVPVFKTGAMAAMRLLRIISIINLNKNQIDLAVF